MADRSFLKHNSQIISTIIIVIVAAIMRVIPHPANIAPIAGLALFSGSYLNKKSSFIIPIGAMIVSDFFLGFHATIPFVYGSFLLITLVGRTLKKWNIRSLFFACIASSFLFYLVTNFGVWLTSTMYIKNISGLMMSYYMGLPFLRNTIIGDLLYGFTFFYGFEYLTVILNKFVFVHSNK